MSMSKSQIQSALSESTGVSKKDVATVLDKLGAFFERYFGLA